MTRLPPVPLSPAARFVACDPNLCVGCQICEFACAAVKSGGADILRSRIRVVRVEPSLMVSIACRGCAAPACVRVCPQPGALAVNPDSQLIDVDDTICDGCGWCIDACPFGVALLDRMAGRVVICDLCRDRADGAACVEMCPKDALEIASPAMVADKVDGGAARALLDEIDAGRG